MPNITCSFLGHRQIEITDALQQKTQHVIENLITHHHVTTFLFGSRSNFIDLCYRVVTTLKAKYPHMQRVGYPCRHEACYLAAESPTWQKLLVYLAPQKDHFMAMDAQRPHSARNHTGKNAYLARNQAMIDDSAFCVFYYDTNYQPPRRRTNRRSVLDDQPHSGTARAYHYAHQQKKIVINLFQQKKPM